MLCINKLAQRNIRCSQKDQWSRNAFNEKYKFLLAFQRFKRYITYYFNDLKHLIQYLPDYLHRNFKKAINIKGVVPRPMRMEQDAQNKYFISS